jgi:hypothetical protein
LSVPGELFHIICMASQNTKVGLVIRLCVEQLDEKELNAKSLRKGDTSTRKPTKNVGSPEDIYWRSAWPRFMDKVTAAD